jgi:hypothetical protein
MGSRPGPSSDRVTTTSILDASESGANSSMRPRHNRPPGAQRHLRPDLAVPRSIGEGRRIPGHLRTRWRLGQALSARGRVPRHRAPSLDNPPQHFSHHRPLGHDRVLGSISSSMGGGIRRSGPALQESDCVRGRDRQLPEYESAFRRWTTRFPVTVTKEWLCRREMHLRVKQVPPQIWWIEASSSNC